MCNIVVVVKESETELLFVGRISLCFLSHRLISFYFKLCNIPHRFYSFDMTANLCFESKWYKEQQMLDYVSMCLYVKSPPLTFILDEWKAFETTFLEGKIKTNVIWNWLMVVFGKNAVYLRRHRQKQREWSRIVWKLDSVRYIMGAWIVQASICGCVCVFASHITGWRFFYIFTSSSAIVLKGFVIGFGRS